MRQRCHFPNSYSMEFWNPSQSNKTRARNKSDSKRRNKSIYFYMQITWSSTKRS
jgi:hypothetical protein